MGGSTMITATTAIIDGVAVVLLATSVASMARAISGLWSATIP